MFGVATMPKIISPGNSDSSLDGLQEQKATLGEQCVFYHYHHLRWAPFSTALHVQSNRLLSILDILICLPHTYARKESLSLHPRKSRSNTISSIEPPSAANIRLNKFVRRLHEMLNAEQEGGIVEWRRGLLILHSISTFSTEVLPRYFNTRNFKTFRRQLNYYGEIKT